MSVYEVLRVSLQVSNEPSPAPPVRGICGNPKTLHKNKEKRHQVRCSSSECIETRVRPVLCLWPHCRGAYSAPHTPRCTNGGPLSYPGAKSKRLLKSPAQACAVTIGAVGVHIHGKLKIVTKLKQKKTKTRMRRYRQNCRKTKIACKF